MLVDPEDGSMVPMDLALIVCAWIYDPSWFRDENWHESMILLDPAIKSAHGSMISVDLSLKKIHGSMIWLDLAT